MRSCETSSFLFLAFFFFGSKWPLLFSGLDRFDGEQKNHAPDSSSSVSITDHLPPEQPGWEEEGGKKDNNNKKKSRPQVFSGVQLEKPPLSPPLCVCVCVRGGGGGGTELRLLRTKATREINSDHT